MAVHYHDYRIGRRNICIHGISHGYAELLSKYAKDIEYRYDRTYGTYGIESKFMIYRDDNADLEPERKHGCMNRHERLLLSDKHRKYVCGNPCAMNRDIYDMGARHIDEWHYILSESDVIRHIDQYERI